VIEVGGKKIGQGEQKFSFSSQFIKFLQILVSINFLFEKFFLAHAEVGLIEVCIIWLIHFLFVEVHGKIMCVSFQ
jgi:hypothetical protein